MPSLYRAVCSLDCFFFLETLQSPKISSFLLTDSYDGYVFLFRIHQADHSIFTTYFKSQSVVPRILPSKKHIASSGSNRKRRGRKEMEKCFFWVPKVLDTFVIVHDDL